MSMTRKALAALALAIGLSASTGTAANAGGCGGSWTVRHGDTLSGIADYCGTTVGAIMAANPWIHHPSYIVAGWRISVPSHGYGYGQRYDYTGRYNGYVQPRHTYRHNYGYAPRYRHYYRYDYKNYGYSPRPQYNYGGGYGRGYGY